MTENLTNYVDNYRAYHVLHGVHWTKIEYGFTAYAEIDFILIAPNGRVLVIEQKTGFLRETKEGLVKHCNGKLTNVRTEIMRAIAHLRTRFERNGSKLEIDYLLYCPDYRVEDFSTAGIDEIRVVDSTKRDKLIKIVQNILPLTPQTPEYKPVLRFFSDTLNLTPDPSALIGQATKLVTRLSGGLAIWARQLEFSPYRLRVVGTAGSGKTQLAIAEFSAALDAGKRPLYVCYNRPLADHFQKLVSGGGRVATFHVLCDSFAREQGIVPDYGSHEVWKQLEQRLANAEIAQHWRFDVVIVDEGQDFSPHLQEAILRLLRPEGRAIWLEDPMQNLYGQQPLEMEGWVTMTAHTNYRSPRQIIEMLARFDAAARPIEAASPFIGDDVETLSYPDNDTEAMLERTKQAITRCLGAGFRRQDIALLSFRGREKSLVLNLDVLGKHALHSFTGSYDLFGKPIFRSGNLLAESIYRFKGQAAPAIIFTEIDFEALDERAFRKLFVGMTRANLKLVLVASESATKIMQKYLED